MVVEAVAPLYAGLGLGREGALFWEADGDTDFFALEEDKHVFFSALVVDAAWRVEQAAFLALSHWLTMLRKQGCLTCWDKLIG